MKNYKKEEGKDSKAVLTNAISKGGAIYVPLSEAQSQLDAAVKDAKKRSYNVDPNQRVCTAAKRKFAALPADLQDTANKWICTASILISRRMDVGRFCAWVKDQAELLLRVFDFKTTCTKNGLDAQHVAEHLVLEGKATCNGIRLNGLESYSGNILLFGDALIPKEYRKLFTKAELNVAEAPAQEAEHE